MTATIKGYLLDQFSNLDNPQTTMKALAAKEGIFCEPVNISDI